MELQEMKTLWDEMSQQVERQQKLTNKLIMEMTQERVRSKINTIGKYEGIGTLVCIPVALLILFNIQKMDSGLLLACAIFCITTLIIIPMISLRLIGQMKQSAISDKNYKQSIIEFAKSRKRFLLLQKLGGIWGIILMLAISPVFNRISGDDAFEYSPFFWIGAVVFVLIFSRWGYKKYEDMTGRAEELLRSLDEEV